MTTIDRYRYDIDEANAIRVWDIQNPNETGAPFFFQPDYPDGKPWENRQAAENWIVNVINNEWLAPAPVSE